MVVALTRRDLLAGLASSTATIRNETPPNLVKGRASVVIIGGGAGGVAAAKHLATAGRNLDITLVERSKTYACFFNSNLYLGGLARFEDLLGGYDALRAKYGVRIVFGNALAIDRARRKISLEDGLSLVYDRLVVSPGVELNYQSVPGWDAAFQQIMPHAWQGADQIHLLKSRLDAIQDGGLIVITAPPDPYCCPPGPYERATMFAHALATSGRRKCKILILDPKSRFAMQGLFEDAWEGLYPGMVEWLDASIYEAITHVDPGKGSIATGFETINNIALANVIPSQSAGLIARRAELANESGYCPIEPNSMRSRYDPNVCVIGDACDGGDMPKSAYGATWQARLAASSICEDLFGDKIAIAELESVCWSALNGDEAIKVSGKYGARGSKISLLHNTVSQIGEDDLTKRRNFAEKKEWYREIWNGMFG